MVCAMVLSGRVTDDLSAGPATRALEGAPGGGGEGVGRRDGCLELLLRLERGLYIHSDMLKSRSGGGGFFVGFNWLFG